MPCGCLNFQFLTIKWIKGLKIIYHKKSRMIATLKESWKRLPGDLGQRRKKGRLHMKEYCVNSSFPKCFPSHKVMYIVHVIIIENNLSQEKQNVATLKESWKRLPGDLGQRRKKGRLHMKEYCVNSSFPKCFPSQGNVHSTCYYHVRTHRKTRHEDLHTHFMHENFFPMQTTWEISTWDKLCF